MYKYMGKGDHWGDLKKMPGNPAVDSDSIQGGVVMLLVALFYRTQDRLWPNLTPTYYNEDDHVTNRRGEKAC